MSIDEAAANAESIGRPLFPAKNVPETYSLGPFSQSSGMVQFCNGKLFGVSQSLAGDVDSFALRTKDLIADYGQPSAVANHGYAEDGLYSDVSLVWRVNGDEVRLAITKYHGVVGTTTAYSSWEQICR